MDWFCAAAPGLPGGRRIFSPSLGSAPPPGALAFPFPGNGIIPPDGGWGLRPVGALAFPFRGNGDAPPPGAWDSFLVRKRGFAPPISFSPCRRKRNAHLCAKSRPSGGCAPKRRCGGRRPVQRKRGAGSRLGGSRPSLLLRGWIERCAGWYKDDTWCAADRACACAVLGRCAVRSMFFVVRRLLGCTRDGLRQTCSVVLLFSLLLRNALGVLLVVDFCRLVTKLHTER